MGMNQNLVIGLLAVVIVIGAGAWLVNAGYIAGVSATTTPVAAIKPSPASPVVMTPAVPVVTTSTLVVASNVSAVLTGKVLPKGSQTSYWYEYGPTEALGMRSVTQAIGSGYAIANAPAFINALAAHTVYFYRLVAENALGRTNGITYSFATNTNPAPTGHAPTVRTDAATNIMSTSVNLEGRTTPNGSATSYWFEYGTSSSLGNTTPFQSVGNGTNSLVGTTAVSGLSPRTQYYFRIDAQNEFGTVTGSILTFTTTGATPTSAPVAHTSEATSVSAMTATLTGTVSPNSTTASYWFEYGTDSRLRTILGTTAHQAINNVSTSQILISANLVSLKRATTYYYRLVASNPISTVTGAIVSFKTAR